MHLVQLVFSVVICVGCRVKCADVMIPKLPKCCPVNESLVLDRKCAPSNASFQPEFWSKEPPPSEIDLVIGNPCLYGRYRLEPYGDSIDEFHLMSNGSLLVPFLLPDQLLGLDQYCLEAFLVEGGDVVLPLICFAPPQPVDKWKEFVLTTIYPIGLLVSVPFLVMTLLAHIAIPELRDTRGKTLACHVICLTVAYISLAIVQLLGQAVPRQMCKPIAFVIQFSFLACFFWLNVLCFDTWRRMRTNRKYSSRSEREERRRFHWYSLYAWLCPTLLLFISMIMDLTPTIPPSYLKPNFGIGSCWFHNDRGALPYFYGPVGLLIGANVILFILSASSIKQVGKEETLTLHHETWSTAEQHKKKMFMQCLTLLLVMGINWVAEVVSWTVGGPPQIWMLTDIFNTLQGIVTFYIFIAKDSLSRGLIKERYFQCCK